MQVVPRLYELLTFSPQLVSARSRKARQRLARLGQHRLSGLQVRLDGAPGSGSPCVAM